jgi:hypothetical protein
LPRALRNAPTSRPAIPHMNEPWYCCAEPTTDQIVSIGQVKPPVVEKALAQPDAFV